MTDHAELTFANGRKITGWRATAIVCGFLYFLVALGFVAGALLV